jgi:hypothetical protein
MSKADTNHRLTEKLPPEAKEARLGGDSAGGPMVNQAVLDHAMSRLRVCIRALSAVMLALLVRTVIDGASPAVVLTGAVIALLLLMSGMLWQYGRRLETRANTSRTESADREIGQP